MNYAGRHDATFVSEGQATHFRHAYVHVDSSQTHAPAGAIIVPDAQLLFHADYSRSGTDLVLTKDDRSFVLHDYFSAEKRAAIASPDGAHLTPDIVKALVGEVHVAQAGNDPAASHVIGHVTKLQGSATVIRNGVSIILTMGDNVEKGDVVQSGANSTLGVTFIDGTVFGLGANARMLLNEMVYDPNGSNNSSLLSLVAGTITFVAGETAKHGDMKIDTPVATMGIRGTAVLVEIDFSVAGQNGQPNASFQVLVEPDGTTGSYILYDKNTLQPIAIVNQAGQQININNGIISQTTTPLSPDLQKLINDVFTLKFTDNSTTKTTNGFTDTVIPTSNGFIIKLADGSSVSVLNPLTGLAGAPAPPAPQSLPFQHRFGTLTVGGDQTLTTTELLATTGDILDQDHVGGVFVFSDDNLGDRPVIQADFGSVAYSNANGVFTLASGQTAPPPGISALQFQDITATVIKLSLLPDPGNTNVGRYTWTYSVPDNQFDFLAAGESLKFTYHITVLVTYLGVTEARTIDITITVTGSNDLPIFTSGPGIVIFDAAGTKTSGGNLVASTPTSGTLDFGDADLTDTHKVSVKLTKEVMSDGGTVPPLSESALEKALTALISDSTGTGKGSIKWQFADLPAYLAAFIPMGVTLTLTYTITVTDSQGATAEQTITVTITGKEAEVWIHTTGDGHDQQWTTGSNWATGTAPTAADDVIIITDQLHPHLSYPVEISSGVAAEAKSVTMNDLADLPPELDVLSGGSLTVGLGGLNVLADSIVDNQGIITIAGKAEFVDHSVLWNSGLLKLLGGGDFKDFAKITNRLSGIIEVADGTLDVQVDITNDGHIVVDSGATLLLEGAAEISGGEVENAGTLTLQDTSELENGNLVNDSTGEVDVTGSGVVFDGETVTNKSSSLKAIDITGKLTLQNGSSIINTAGGGGDVSIIDGAGGETIETTGQLILADTSFISGGTVTNDGTLTLEGASELENGNLVNDSTGEVDVTGTGVVFDGETVTNKSSSLKAIDIKGKLTLQNASSITNVTGGETVESTGQLILADTSFISGGTVTNDGTLTLEGTSELENGNLVNDSTGEVDVTGTGVVFDGETVTNKSSSLKAVDVKGKLTLQDGSSITNTAGGETVEALAALILADASYISGGTVTNDGTLTLEGTSELENGNLVNDSTGQVNVTGTGNVFDGETVTNDGTGNKAIDVSGKLTLRNGSSITNLATNGETVESTGQLILADTSFISGGTVTNDGTLTLQGTSELENGALVNDSTGEVDITGTGVVFDGETVTNKSSSLKAIDIKGKLTLQDGSSITNTAGGETVESTGQLILADTSFISGGTLTNDGTLTLQGTSELENGALVNDSTGEIDVTGTGNIFDGETVTNKSSSLKAIDIKGKLTLQDGSSITNVSGGETVESTGQLILADTSFISGGTVTNDGILTLQGTSELENGALVNDSTGEVDVTGTGVVFDGETVTNKSSSLKAIDIKGKLTLQDGSSITNVSGGETVESTGQLILADTSFISGGTLTNDGTVTLQGTSELENGNLVNDSTGEVDITGTGVVFDGETVTNKSSSLKAIDIKGKLTLQDGSSITNVSGGETVEALASLILADTSFISGGTLTNDGTVTLQGTSELENGNLVNDSTGEVDVTGTGVVFDGETVTNKSSSLKAIDVKDKLTLQNASSITNVTGGETVESTGQLILADTSFISGGTVTNDGTLTLEGTSELENGNLVNDSTGEVDVTGTGVVFDGETVTNKSSSLKAVDVKGKLTLQDGSSITNTAGGETVEALAALILADASYISGGTVTNDGTLTLEGTSELENGNLVNDSTGQVNVTGTGNVFDGETVTNDGTGNKAIDVSGKLTLRNGSSITNLATNGETVESTGQLILADTSFISGGTVTNDGTLTLQGSSELENGALVNDSTGEIDVTGTGNIFDGETVTNKSSSLKAIDVKGKLTLQDGSSITNTAGGETVESTGQLILADTSFISGGTLTNDGMVTLQGTSELENGTLVNDSTGEVDVTGTGVVFDGETVTNNGTGKKAIDIKGKLTLQNASSITNLSTNGETVESTGQLILADTSFIGGGTLANLGNIYVENATGVVFDGVNVANTGGTIHVDASGGGAPPSPATLILKDSTAIMGGLLDIGAFGTLEIETVGGAALSGVTVNVEGGGIVAVDAGSELDLENTNINGGKLKGPGKIATGTGNIDSKLNGVTLESGTTVIAAVGELDLTGIINATGAEIDANSGSGISLDLENVTLNGGTLGGSGKIGTATGNISSTLNGVSLKSGTRVTAAVGTLNLTGTISATGAEIDANSGSGIAIDLESLTLIGATLGGLGVIATVSGVNTFNGVTIDSGTSVTVTDNTTLDLVGTITDRGTIALNSTGDSTQLKITGSVVLNGGGRVTLTDNAGNAVVSDGFAATFNNFDTITGAGTIGDGQLTLVNSGIIDATGSHALIIDTGTNTVTTTAGPVGNILVTNNAGGVLEASAGHTLQIYDNVLNNGLIQAGNSGSNLAALVVITGNITGIGSIELFNHATVEIGGSVSTGQTVTFESAGGGSLLILDDSHDFHGTIFGLTEFSTESLENHVDLKDLKFISGHMSAHFINGVLVISDGIDSVSLHVSGASDTAFEIASDGHGGTLIDDPAAASGTVTIDSNTALDISGASTATVSFANNAGNSGELVLDHSQDFAGQITGFAGDGTLENSDVIDLQDIDFAGLTTETYVEDTDGTGGTLTLSDGTHTARIKFAENYVLDNFKFVSDGHGGTLIVDSGNYQTLTIASSDSTIGLNGNHETVVFNFSNLGHTTVNNFDAATDLLEFNHSQFAMFANDQAILNAAFDDGHGNTVITIDGQDMITLAGIHKNQLSVHDFHLV